MELKPLKGIIYSSIIIIMVMIFGLVSVFSSKGIELALLLLLVYYIAFKGFFNSLLSSITYDETDLLIKVGSKKYQLKYADIVDYKINKNKKTDIISGFHFHTDTRIIKINVSVFNRETVDEFDVYLKYILSEN